MATSTKTTVLFSLGSNGSGQLGVGHNQDISIPRQVIFATESTAAQPPAVTRVAAGGNHTLLLTSSGCLYQAGDASTGACGPSSTSAEKFIAHEIIALPKHSNGDTAPVKLIAASWEASVIVQADAEGRNTIVSTFGAGAKGELGQGQFVIRTPTISPFKNFPPSGTEVVDLAACMGHVVAVLNNGEAWGWGAARKGQLGLTAAAVAGGTVQEPIKIAFDGDSGCKVARAACGREFTALFAAPDDGRVVILGADKAGVSSAAPERVVGWQDVGASWGGVYMLRRKGDLLSWGKNDHGQLAPDGLPPLNKMAVGSEHVIGMTAEGDVLCWGWGEHGNCGPQTEGGDVKGHWNVIASKKYIPPGSDITAIGAGCATSWVSVDISSQS